MNSPAANPHGDDQPPIRYLTPLELVHLNSAVLGREAQVRDSHLLKSAAARPIITLFGQEQFPTLVDKAAALLHSLAYHHLFADGNKRTAIRAVTLFLELNGHRLVWPAADQAAFVLEVAQGQHNVEAVAAHLRPLVTAG